MSATLVAAQTSSLSNGSGCSEAFGLLQSAIKGVGYHTDESIFLGWRQQLRSTLAEIVQETSKRGWDGYDAEPLVPLAMATADYLINLLPETQQRPEIVPAPNGEIAFEWNRGENYMLSIATHQGELVYAALLGPHRKQYGQEPLGDELPRPIATILETHFSKV